MDVISNLFASMICCAVFHSMTVFIVMKEQLRFIKNIPATHVQIRNQHYPVHIAGTGKIPLLSIGIGSHLQMTLPAELLNIFTVYSTDLYWISSQKIANPEQLTMADLVDDIFSVTSQLKLSDCIITGFSCFGILALEAAKRIDKRIKAAILLSTPTGWNADIIAAGQAYFEQHASAERKQNDAKRKAHFVKIKQSNFIDAYAADAARYWRDFNISRDFFDLLWQDIAVDDAVINHFFSTLLPTHELTKDLEQLQLPVVLFSGQLDYDSIPLLLWKTSPKPRRFTVIDCDNTGHWPQLEEPDFFSQAMKKWLEEERLNNLD